MSKKITPNETLTVLNKAIASAIEQLHAVQGARKPGSLHIITKTQHKPSCLGCPHYVWAIWQPKKAKRGSDIGGIFYVAMPCKAPTRAVIAKKNPKVMGLVNILIKLMDQRSKLVEAISRAERSAHATVKLLEGFART